MELAISFLRLLYSACDLAVTVCAVGGFVLASECRKRLRDIEDKSQDIVRKRDEVTDRDDGSGDSDER